MSVGTITTAGGEQFVLEVFRTDRGAVEDVHVVEEEELTAPGVDGRRWRTVGNRYRPFKAAIVQTALLYLDAIDLARQYDGMTGSTVALSVTIGGVLFAYPSVHVLSASVRAMPGTVAGATNASTHGAYVTGELDLVVVEQEEGANP